MKNNWFRERLTKAKQRSPMWTELADAVQQAIEEAVEPIINRLRGSGSVLTMGSEDLERRLQELGSFFYLSPRVDDVDRPAALLQRLDEIHLKKTDVPLKSALSREFQGLGVEWAPLFAPTDQELWPYGTRFSTIEGVGEDWFMTSRGVIRIPLLQLRKVYAQKVESPKQIEEFERVIQQYIEPLIPLHIVMDGIELFVLMELVDAPEVVVSPPPGVEVEYPAANDFIEFGAGAVDADIEWTCPRHQKIHPYWYAYRARLDSIPLDAWSLDRDIPGSPTGSCISRYRLGLDAFDANPVDSMRYGCPIPAIPTTIPQEFTNTPRLGSTAFDAQPLGRHLPHGWNINYRLEEWMERIRA